MPEPVAHRNVPDRRANKDSTIRRIRNLLDSVDLDCTCRGRLDTALQRFAELERFRVRRHALAAARHERLRIASVLHLLEELEDLPVAEPDESVFRELAELFGEVVWAARNGEALLRELCSDDDEGLAPRNPIPSRSD